MSLFSQIQINGIPLWIVLLMCIGVFFSGFMDAIAGGGGTISVPTYLLGLHGLPSYFVLGTNKLSSSLGTIISAARFIKSGFIRWKLVIPCIFLSLLGSMGGTWLQHHTPDIILKYLLLAVLPVIAFFTFRAKNYPDEPEEIPFHRQALLSWAASLLIGMYDGYYGPGCGTFLMLAFIRLAKLETRVAAGHVKLVNLASNLGSLITALTAGYVLVGVGLICAAASFLGHYIGSGLAIKNGSKIIRPAVVAVLLLLTVKTLSELLFPQFWT